MTETTKTNVTSLRPAIDTSRFERSHGRKPSGQGSWAFCPADKYNGDYLPHCMWYTGKFSDAKKVAVEHFRKLGVVAVVVCS